MNPLPLLYKNNVRIMKITVDIQQETTKDCILCGTPLGKPSVAVHKAPALLGCVETPPSKDIFTDYRICTCPCCSLIQTDVAPSKEQYNFVHSHAVGGIWAKHREALLAFICTHTGDAVRRVLEIGPSVSPLAHDLKAKIIRYFDLMESCPFELFAHETYETCFFPSQKPSGTFDLIMASHVLEHSHDLKSFLQAIQGCLATNGVAVLSIPNFRSWINNGYFNAFSREHVVYPYREQITYACSMVGLKATFDSFSTHSLFMALEHDGAEIKSPYSEATRNTDAARWALGMNRIVKHFDSLAIRNEAPLILAGASHLSQYLYLMSDTIAQAAQGVVDNATDKHEKRIYGTKLKAHPFDYIKQFKSPAIIIPPSSYAQEMAQQVLTLNPKARILT